jgi:hypothetical protein
MKFLVSLFFLSIIAFANAQPGDIFAAHRRKMQKVEKALQNEPNNVSLIWERLELAFKPHFDLYKRAETLEGFQYSQIAYPYYILEDLNYLIDIKASIAFKKEQVSVADFYHRRGQFLYVIGYSKYSLQHYLAALAHSPTFKLKQKICIALAAYYYNLSETYSLENYEKALAYIDLVTPKEDINKPLVYERYTSRNGDRFQREKIQLLKAAKKEARLVTYLKCIAKSHLFFYEKEREKPPAYQKSHSYTIKHSLQIGLRKLYEIAVYFYENGNYEKAKETIEKVILFIPKNTHGHYYETYAYGNYFVLLSKIYSTNQYQNVPLEIDNLLEGFGDPYQGIPSQAAKQYKRLEELLALYPNTPKLYLAKTIYLWKVKFNSGHVKPDGSLFELLLKTKELGLQDYRIFYLRAIILKQEKKYTEALVEINKAEFLCSGRVNVYGLKLNILRNIEGADEAVIAQTKSLLEASQKEEKVNIASMIKMIYAL